ncbi:MAG TPA: glycine/betaine ABC transporter substrate-binding protein [Pseudomonas sp.]|nr:glycine/betaine ABC transporter substrate-binding protein [Pseudomonas sp.]
MQSISRSFLMLVGTAILSTNVMAAEPAACKNVRLGVVNWTDVMATSAMTQVLLDGLGYQTKQTSASQQIIFAGIRDQRLDMFLGYWNPIMTQTITPFVDAGQVKVLDAPSLSDARATLAVPKYLADKGLKTFADIHKFEKELGGKIYGIEPGNDGNRTIQSMIDKNAFGLKDAGFKVVESSEAGMLSQVDRAVKRHNAVVFLGWEPHPMNTRFEMKYLTGGDDFFGPDFGKATVLTNTRKGYVQECANVGQLLKNLSFTLDMESTLMGNVLDDKIKPDAAAKAWLKKNPQVLDTWLAGVTTVDGKPGLEAAKAKLTQ